VKQEVYKRLVLANYLAEKELKASCEIEDAMNYHLKVHINGGYREYRWTACEKSWDGVNLTEIAEYIIEQSEKNQNEKPEVTVQGYVLELKDNTLLIGEELNILDYEWIKEELLQTDLDSYVFDFTILEGVNTSKFKLGDKVHATIAGSVRGSKPGRATVKEIEEKGIKGPINFSSLYLRFWIGKTVLIADSKEGFKRQKKNRSEFKVIFGIVSG
jgi:hypothetical protein